MAASLATGCIMPDPTDAKLDVTVQGAGSVVSRDGAIDCAANGTASAEICEIDRSVSWNADPSSLTYELCAVPAAGGTSAFVEWDFAVSGDCPDCNAADPEMGALDAHGNDAVVRLDENAGYDVDDTLTAVFQPTGTTDSSAGVETCW
ncbi:MAG TPA: hypothetical protein VLX92_14610 [Kofleriaceae bacterium]|nr:hypothetical protein [Kofleriaceae bacterium]